jgi:hypothetical protein
MKTLDKSVLRLHPQVYEGFKDFEESTLRTRAAIKKHSSSIFKMLFKKFLARLIEK